MAKFNPVVCFLLACLIYSTEAYGQDRFEFTVASDGTGDFKGIQEAIDACKAFPTGVL